ncbi:hypothetical protein U8527_05180 [Kordia algicida OT-1]|uniref:Prenyltransferase n=1 Tax=Kordia algicida OT-1 TaxID=391587 RepID=A9DMI5_9FLAO|nr:hypothetical protein [Kordia algicida]EDP97714.1 hypothetical protein KAOT1_21167 [Kordia algicida OT-1]
MDVFKKLFNFYLDSSIHIGLSVYALTYCTLMLFGLPYDEAVLYFTFYGTIVTYNFIKYGSSAKQYFFVTTKYMKIIQYVSFVCFVLTVYYAYQLQLQTLLVAVGLSLLSSLYIIPFLPNRKNFRTLAGFKISIVALCWTGVTVVIPLVNANAFVMETTVLLTCLQRFILILILMIPFEISDLSYDEEALGTLPQRIGIKRTKQIAYVWIVLFLVLEYAIRSTISTAFYMTVGVSIVLFASIWYSGIKKSKYFTSFWVESIPIVWFLLLVFV